MAWRDRLRTASFRGIPFFVEAAETGFGRNVVVHEYPGQAPPFFEDLGKRARTYEVEAYLLGDDFQTTRDRLVVAVEEDEGPGDLVHPDFGTVRVVCRSLTVREGSREGRMARLALSFVPYSVPSAPSDAPDPGAAVGAAVGKLFKAAEDDFVGAWNPIDEPAVLTEAGAAQASSFWDFLADLKLSGPSDLVADWRGRLVDLTDGTIGRLSDPGSFASEVTGFLEELLDVVGSRRAALEAFLGLAGVEPSPSFGNSSAAIEADANRDAVGRLFRESAVALAGQAAAEIPFETYEDAVATRSRVLDALSTVQDQAEDLSYQALGGVQAALSSALPLDPGTLPRLRTFELPEASSALVLAYRLFDDPDRADEIVSRNRLPNPLTIPGGTTLEVLSRA